MDLISAPEPHLQPLAAAEPAGARPTADAEAASPESLFDDPHWAAATRQSGFEDTLFRVLALVVDGEDLPARIHAALARLGETVDADRATVFAFGRGTTDAAPAATPRIAWTRRPCASQVPVEPPAHWHPLLSEGRTIAATAQSPSAPDRGWLKSRAAGALFGVPIRRDRPAWGFVLFEFPRENGACDQGVEALLRVAGSAVGLACLRMQETQTLRILLEEARQFLRLKTRFVSLVSHEFRTPLAGILSAAELLEDCHDRLEAGRRAAYFAMIKREIGHLSATLEELLVLGRLDAETPAPRTEVILLDEFCRKTAAEVHLAYSNRAPVAFEGAGDSARAAVDACLLHHILVNLLSNAYKYSSPSGEVALRVAMTPGELSLEVHDHGVGIPEADIERLFQPFFSGSHVRDIKGSGLGLYIVRKCVEACSGSIRVDSTVGCGSVFHVRLPLQPPNNSAP